MTTTVKPVRICLKKTHDTKFSDGVPDKDKNFEFVDIPEVLSKELKDNEILVQAEYISVDPYLRGRLLASANTKERVLTSGQVAKVIKSKSDKFKPNDIIFGYFPWQTMSVVPVIPQLKIQLVKRPDKNESKEDNELSHSYFLGAYGMPGLTAYYGLIEVAQIQPNSVLLVTGGAGAVGSVVGQIGKILNCFVIASAGTQEKLDWMKNELKFDFVFNYKKYKTREEVTKVLKEAIKLSKKKGINYYFDNTGGVITQASWDLLEQRAKVIVCGQISNYNRTDKDGESMIPDFLGKLIYKEIMIKGIYVYCISKEYREKFDKEMKQWLLDGKIKVKETTINGFNNTPDALIGLFSGKNIGKMVVKC